MRVNVFSYMLWAVCAAVVDVSNHFRSCREATAS